MEAEEAWRKHQTGDGVARIHQVGPTDPHATTGVRSAGGIRCSALLVAASIGDIRTRRWRRCRRVSARVCRIYDLLVFTLKSQAETRT